MKVLFNLEKTPMDPIGEFVETTTAKQKIKTLAESLGESEQSVNFAIIVNGIMLFEHRLLTSTITEWFLVS